MTDPLEFEVTDNERRHLATMMKSPGFIVLEKIFRAYIDAAEQGAILSSKSDPLANADSAARKWAYVAIAEQVLENIKAGVKFELDLLQMNEAPPSDPQDLARRRRIHASFGSLGPLPER